MQPCVNKIIRVAKLLHAALDAVAMQPQTQYSYSTLSPSGPRVMAAWSLFEHYPVVRAERGLCCLNLDR